MNPPLPARAFLFAAAVLLAFQGPVFAGSHDAEIGLFVKYCLNESEAFSKERMGQSSVYTISIGKFETGLGTMYTVKDSFMIRVNESNYSDISIIQNPQEVEGILTDKYTAMNITFNSLYPSSFEMGEILAKVLEFNQSREPQESACKLSTGQDRFDCSDLESCLRACYSPMCSPVAQGVGWPFVRSLWHFSNNTKAMDSNVSAIITNIDEIETRSQDAEVLFDELEEHLTAIQNASTEISQSPIFDSWRYSFCWPIKYNRTSIITAKVLTRRLKERMSIFFIIPKEAQAMVESGEKRSEICRLNRENAEKPKTRRSFWAKLSMEERNFVRLVSAEAPGIFFPASTRRIGPEWE